MDYMDNPELVMILPDYFNMTIRYGTFRLILIILLIVMICILITLIIVGSYQSNQLQIIPVGSKIDLSRFKKSKLAQTIYNDLSSSSTGILNHVGNGVDLTTKEKCENSKHRYWDMGKCICKSPYFGPSCDKELHHDSYTGMGQFIPNDKMSIIDEFLVHNRSFPYDVQYTTCQEKCDRNEHCVGFMYKEIDSRPSTGNNKCILISEEPNGDSTSNLKLDHNLYLKNGKRIKMKHKVLLMSGTIPIKFWFQENFIGTNYQIASIGFDKINRIAFIPNVVVNDSEAIIVYHNDTFTIERAREVAENFRLTGQHIEGWYVHMHGINDISPNFSIFRENGYYFVMALSNYDLPLPPNYEISPIYELSDYQQDNISNYTITRDQNILSVTIDDSIEEECHFSNTLSMSRDNTDGDIFRSEWSL